MCLWGDKGLNQPKSNHSPVAKIADKSLDECARYQLAGSKGAVNSKPKMNLDLDCHRRMRVEAEPPISSRRIILVHEVAWSGIFHHLVGLKILMLMAKPVLLLGVSFRLIWICDWNLTSTYRPYAALHWAQQALLWIYHHDRRGKLIEINFKTHQVSNGTHRAKVYRSITIEKWKQETSNLIDHDNVISFSCCVQICVVSQIADPIYKAKTYCGMVVCEHATVKKKKLCIECTEWGWQTNGRLTLSTHAFTSNL